MNNRVIGYIVIAVGIAVFALLAASRGFAVTLGAFFTIGIFSFLYKDNPYYKFSEAVFVGISAGYWFVSLFWQNMYSKLIVGVMAAFNTTFVQGAGWDDRWMMLVGGLLGILMLMRLFPKAGWISRWPLAVVVGATAGLYFINYFVSNGIIQLGASAGPLQRYDAAGNLDWWATISQGVLVVGTLSGLIYFYFSKEHKGAFGGVAKIGIWTLMLTFGASFGYTVMSRMSLLIGRMDYLMGDWLRLIN
ncbi:hypothetical protein ACFLQW_02845 [Candidatus Zixiibacteriota bacterium]